MTKTEGLRREVFKIVGEQTDVPTTRLPIEEWKTATDITEQILKACKESGLMFCEQREGEREDGVWWKYKVITEPIEVE
ncbi:hypothetical protein LCGC14_0396320 [marine sediment metagenome]|uniref:Uncharacterized protein n=1 Tax=marine sediment metagenome TaxID=412755 RepID=A0A0F9SY44_9ZZZZ